MKLWKQLSVALVIALTVLSMPVLAADTYKLTTGVVGGTYHNRLGVNMRNVLREQGVNFEVLPSKGSVDNLNRINDGEADAGYTQADAMATWLRTNPTADIEILGALGQECAFLVTHKDSGIEEIQDLNNADQKIGIGEVGAGSAETWESFRTLNATYAEPQVFYQGGASALGKVQTGELDAFLWVTTPENREHNLLRAVLVDGSPFRFVEIDDDKLADTLPNGTEVYTPYEVVGRENTGWLGGDEEVDTVCTGLTVVADYNLDSAVQEQLAMTILMNANRITGN